MTSKNEELSYYKQNDIHFIVNQRQTGHSANFSKIHGPSISSMAFRVENADNALKVATMNGAKAAVGEFNVPAIYGIGDSLIYFVDQYQKNNFYNQLGFSNCISPEIVSEKGFLAIDHLTNNVEKGTMTQWGDFYKKVFGFTEVRYFDIKGAKTGLTSYALKSPCGTFCIPINEGNEKKSQINEYLEEYKGPGIQHLAFLTNDIVSSLDALSSAQIETLAIDDEYYDDIFKKIKKVTEDHKVLRKHNILIDGDDDGYLLQIFTKNLIGPIFIEIIQRKNHFSFGEGNFAALFRSIELDQQKRGYLD
jgi:4-hydroxyphenylpyruvate dioxygenase